MRGKTTLLNQVIGLARPTAGRIYIDGNDAVADPAMARRLRSMQPQSQAPLDGVGPRESIELMARIRGADRHQAKRRTAALIEALDIGEWADVKGDKLSGGVRRLTAFAVAAAEPGRLVMFDEPTNDVDPVRRRLLWGRVRALARAGCAVVLVTHNVLEAERAVDRLAILDQGRVVAQGTPSSLRGEHIDQLRVELVAVSEAVAHELAGELTGLEQPIIAGRRTLVPIKAEDCPRVLGWAQLQRQAGRVDEFSFNPSASRTSTSGLAYTLKPVLVGLATNLIIIVALMFAPVNYPAKRLPDWAAAAHQWLPFQYMAEAVRGTVDVPPGDVPLLPFVVLIAWRSSGSQ